MHSGETERVLRQPPGFPACRDRGVNISVDERPGESQVQPEMPRMVILERQN